MFVSKKTVINRRPTCWQSLLFHSRFNVVATQLILEVKIIDASDIRGTKKRIFIHWRVQMHDGLKTPSCTTSTLQESSPEQDQRKPVFCFCLSCCL
jgi:hypothetical protein